MAHPVNRCADCDLLCEEGEPCTRDLCPDEDLAYDAEQDQRICEAAP